MQCHPAHHASPYYGMGALLYRVPGGYAPWPGEKGWVSICLAAAVRGLRSLATSLSFAAWLRRRSASRGRGAVTLRLCDPKVFILLLRGGVYGEVTPSSDCPDLCVGLRLGKHRRAIRRCAMVCWGLWPRLAFFYLPERATSIWSVCGLSASACQKGFRGFLV